MRISDRDLQQILAQGESYRVECKESLAGDARARVREAICAFANDLPETKLPGYVFVGVDDDRNPTGLRVDDELLNLLTGIRNEGNILPVPTTLVERRKIGKVDVAVITVLPSNSPPVRYKGRIHVRLGPRRGLATPQEERILNEKRRSRDVPFDIQPVRGVAVKELNTRQFEDEYLPNAFASDVIEANERSLDERLAATKMIAGLDDTRPTILGLLVIGKRPRDFIDGSYIQFLRIDGEDLAGDIIDQEEISGTILEMIRRLDEKLRTHNFRRIDITSTDREVQRERYPLPALQQLSRNAIMHRTYEATNAPIRVTWFNSSIEIMSPGGGFGVVNRDNFGHPGVTDYRNPNLAEAMRVLGYVQRFGVGIATANKHLSNAGQSKAEFQVEDGTVLAKLYEKAT